MESFDAEKLQQLKLHHCGYTFCPRCSKPLAKQNQDGHWRMVCTDDTCGFIFYQNPAPAAGAIIVEKKKVLLVKRAHDPRKHWWCLPAGFMEWKEHPSQTAIREVKEETGAIIELDSLFDVYSGDDDPRTNAVLILYLARIVGGTLAASDDALELKWFPLTELPDDIAFQAHQRALADYRQRFNI
jgi:ADP-ribose pyrophosphatase YjhB (NUDIX family)